MGQRAAAWIAWSLWALSLALTALSLLLLASNLSHPGVHIFDHWLDCTLFAMGFSTVGAVIASRTPPDNAIGWLFCVVGLLFFSQRSASPPPTLPLPSTAIFISAPSRVQWQARLADHIAGASEHDREAAMPLLIPL